MSVGCEALRFFVAFFIFSLAEMESVDSNNGSLNAMYDRKCGQKSRTRSEISGVYAKFDSSAKNHYVVDNDGGKENASNLASSHDERFNYYYDSSVVNRLDSPVNSKSQNILVNKCCSWDSYFDVENFNCVESPGRFRNETTSDLFYSDDAGSDVIGERETKYSFVEHVPNCGRGSVLSISIVPSVELRNSGISLMGNFFPRYCVDENPDYPNRTIVLACRDSDSFCRGKTCFRKCCPLKESYEQSGRKCRRMNRPFKPEFVDFPSLKPKMSVSPFEIGLFLGDACKKEGKYLLEKDEGEISYLDLDGTLYVPMYKKCFGEDEFCIEHVQLDNYTGLGSFLCFSDGSGHFENSQLQYFLLSLGLIISCTFLLITFFVYLFSPNSRNLYGKASMCYITCLFSAYLSLAVVELMSTKLNKSLCIYMGYLILFSFLAAFFWLNVISYDIWKTFRVVRSIERSSTDNDKKRIKFLWYSLYAWSFPCVITITCSVVNQIPNFPYDAIKPDIGEENCWFSREKKGIYFFFITPISLIIASNVIFYIQTAWRIWKVKSDINKMGKQKRKKFTASKDQFLINGKLFIVMGITWSLEIVSFFAPHPIWYVTDTANALHGVFIFAVFVLKKKVLRQISHQMRHPLKGMKQFSSPSSCSPNSGKNNSKDTNSKEKSEGSAL